MSFRQGIRTRRGSMMLIAALLCLLMLMGASTLFFTTKTDVQTSVNLEREIRATNLFESIVAQLEARAARRIWSARFWQTEALKAGRAEPSIVINEESGHVDLSADALPAGSYRFSGIVKDLKSALKTYRIYVEIEIDGEKFSFACDKQYEEGVFSGLNRDSSILDKKLDGVDGTGTPTDQYLDKVKVEAVKPSTNTIQSQFSNLLDKLKTDSNAYKAAGQGKTQPIGEEPVLPAPPTTIP